MAAGCHRSLLRRAEAGRVARLCRDRFLQSAAGSPVLRKNAVGAGCASARREAPRREGWRGYAATASCNPRQEARYCERMLLAQDAPARGAKRRGGKGGAAMPRPLPAIRGRKPGIAKECCWRRMRQREARSAEAGRVARLCRDRFLQSAAGSPVLRKNAVGAGCASARREAPRREGWRGYAATASCNPRQDARYCINSGTSPSW